jgi:hypothetical protein
LLLLFEPKTRNRWIIMNELPFIHIFSYCFFQIYCLWL